MASISITGVENPTLTSMSPKSCISTNDNAWGISSVAENAARNSLKVSGPKQENINRPLTLSTRRHSANTRSGCGCQCNARLDHTRSTALRFSGNCAKLPHNTLDGMPDPLAVFPGNHLASNRSIDDSAASCFARAAVSMATEASTPSMCASVYCVCKSDKSAPSPHPASSTRRGLILTSAKRSCMRAATSRRKKSDSATRSGMANNCRTRRRSIGALNAESEEEDGNGTGSWRDEMR